MFLNFIIYIVGVQITDFSFIVQAKVSSSINDVQQIVPDDFFVFPSGWSLLFAATLVSSLAFPAHPRNKESNITCTHSFIVKCFDVIPIICLCLQ